MWFPNTHLTAFRTAIAREEWSPVACGMRCKHRLPRPAKIKAPSLLDIRRAERSSVLRLAFQTCDQGPDQV